MSNREEAIRRVIDHEGGYVDHPSDPGGATKYGITQRTARAHGYHGDMRHLPIETAITIYTRTYWDKNQCGDLPFPLAFQYFDACVNNGSNRARLWLQRAIGVADDGIIGPITISEANKGNAVSHAAKFCAQRTDFFTRLSTWDDFGKGWTRRMSSNMTFLAQDASA